MKTGQNISLLAGLFIILLLSTGCRDPNPEKARKLLQEVSQKYEDLGNFELEATVTSTVTVGINTRTSVYPVYYAMRKPGDIRYVVDHDQSGVQLVSDGNTTWTYLPSSKQLKIEQAGTIQMGSGGSPGTRSSEGFMDYGMQITRDIKSITHNLEKAEISGEKRVSVNDSTRSVYVVKASYGQQVQPEKMEVSPTTYWIDPAADLVLMKETTVNAFDPGIGKNVRIERQTKLDRIELDPVLSDTLFQFTRPDSAQVVESFSLPDREETKGWVGRRALNFELSTLDGDTLALEDLEGNIVVLDFWATWCGPCRKAHPHLEKLHRELKDRGVVILGINSEPPEKIREYIQRHDYTFTNLLDSDQEVIGKYRVSTIPALFVIDREGKISSRLVGYQTERRMRKAIEDAGL